MFGWFKRFKKEPVQIGSGLSEKLDPRPGEKWIFDPCPKEPWPRSPFPPVTILDVQNGWVRYAFQSVFTDERQRVDQFMKMYRRA